MYPIQLSRGGGDEGGGTLIKVVGGDGNSNGDDEKYRNLCRGKGKADAGEKPGHCAEAWRNAQQLEDRMERDTEAKNEQEKVASYHPHRAGLGRQLARLGRRGQSGRQGIRRVGRQAHSWEARRMGR